MLRRGNPLGGGQNEGPSQERAEGYLKRALDSIGSEKTTVGSARPYANHHRPGAFWAVALICRLVSIDVNPCVDATTGELNADKSTSASVLLPPIDGSGVARQVHVFARHLPKPHKVPKFPILRSPGRQNSRLGVLGKDRILQPGHLNWASVARSRGNIDYRELKLGEPLA